MIEGRMKKLEVVPHDPAWRMAFETESMLIVNALGKNVIDIFHIGSTSVPGIYAKPVIDSLVKVDDIADVESRSAEMEGLGYEVKGEFGIPGRRYFRKDNAAGIRTHQIHVFENGSPQIGRHVAFRDFMLAHPGEAHEYSELKRRLAEKYPGNPDSYMDGKESFINEIDRRAALWLASKTSR